MAHLIPTQGAMQHGIPTPLSIIDLQEYVSGFVKFINLPGGDFMVVNEEHERYDELNQTATILAKQPICGPAVLIHPGEIE